jgi:hypothetical protein
MFGHYLISDKPLSEDEWIEQRAWRRRRMRTQDPDRPPCRADPPPEAAK